MKSVIAKTLIVVTATGTLGGCASYQSERPNLAYFVVPCSTPGAFPAQLLNTAEDGVTAASRDLPPDPAKAVAAGSKGASTCLVAAATGRPYSPAYSAYGYAPYYPYPRHYGGAIGGVLHGGGNRGGHHGGGHRRH